MKILLVTDAWKPQVNGVVTTLVELCTRLAERGHQVEVIEPGQFRTRPCPGYPGIDLAVSPGRELARRIDAFSPDAIHLATEGPLGWAARRHCLRQGLSFTTAFHTKFPEIAKAATGIPLWLGYWVMRWFHRPSSGIMVPTPSVLRMLDRRGLRRLRQWTHGVDTSLFQFQPASRVHPLLGEMERPVLLFVGRVSYEKNIQTFLDMPFPGTKVVCGEGPVREKLQARYPSARWLGVLPRDRLAEVYGAADVFVFPSHADTFGLVLLEAMACGTPAAAFPVDGPLEVLARRHADGRPVGGSLHEDLASACRLALQVPRSEARARALDFSWDEATVSFERHLVLARGGASVAPPVDAVPGAVTNLSSPA